MARLLDTLSLKGSLLLASLWGYDTERPLRNVVWAFNVIWLTSRNFDIKLKNWVLLFPSEFLSLFADSTPRRNARRRHLSRNTLIRLLINRTERRRQRRISRGHLSSSTEVHFSNLKITNQRKFETKFAKNRHFRRDTGWINNPRNESLPQHTQTDENNPKCVHKLKGVAKSLSLSLRPSLKQTDAKLHFGGGNVLTTTELEWSFGRMHLVEHFHAAATTRHRHSSASSSSEAE